MSFLTAVPPSGRAAEAEPAPTASVDPIDPAERGRLADLLFRTGRYREAIGEFASGFGSTRTMPVSGLEISVNTMAAGQRYFALAKVCAKRDDLEAALRFLRRARACGLENFARVVASETAFAEMLAIPRYAELLQQP